MGQTKIGKSEKEVKEYMKLLVSTYMNIIFQLLKILATSLTDEILKQIAVKVSDFTIELINNEFEKKCASGSSQSEPESKNDCK